MIYIELNITLNEEYADILVAELAEIGFESFIDTESGFKAYIPQDHYESTKVAHIVKQYEDATLSFEVSSIGDQNWNQEWESNYDPIIVEDQCIIKASFHTDLPSYPIEIIINPKMSFGTGHHETTHLMIVHLLKQSLKSRSVLDAGCGTGVLAILAEKLGANNILAFDIDEWAYENTLENININQCINIQVERGDVSLLKNQNFQLVLANINKNVLLNDIPHYAQVLDAEGLLIVSGFYEEDIADIEEIAHTNKLRKLATLIKNKWTSIVFQKI